MLGSGLGSFAENVDVAAEVSYADIEGLPRSTAPTHAGRLVFGTLDGDEVVQNADESGAAFTELLLALVEGLS